MEPRDRESILIQLTRTEEALKYTCEQIKDLKEQFQHLHGSTIKQADEIRDCFFMVEDNRKRIEELADSLKEEMSITAESVDKFKKIIDEFDERKDKKTLNFFQLLVTSGAVVAGFIVEYFRRR